MKAPRAGAAGFTLIEMLIAFMIAVLLTSAIFTLFLSQANGLKGAQNVVDMQDAGRVGLEMIAHDIRNAGFFVQPQAQSVRVEDNCAASNLYYNSGAFQLASGGTQVIQNGKNLGAGWTGAPATGTACPNGSDRLQIVYRPDTSWIGGDVTNNGTDHNFIVDCPNNDCTKAFGANGIPGTCSQACSPATMMCNSNDPTKCTEVSIGPGQSSGNGSCDGCPATANCNIKIYVGASCASPISGPGWGLVGGKGPASFQSYRWRTWQLLDMDGDGVPELVYSDKFHDAELAEGQGGPTPIDPQWNVVAYGVEDLQFAFAHLSAGVPSWTNNMALWEMGGTGCTASASVDCLAADYSANNLIVALRVSMVLRSLKLEQGVKTGSLTVENNNAAGPVGYRRRVVSTVVALRNLYQVSN